MFAAEPSVKARALVNGGRVSIVRDFGDGRIIAEVHGETEVHTIVRNMHNRFVCSCLWASFHPEQVCSHVQAVKLMLSERR